MSQRNFVLKSDCNTIWAVSINLWITDVVNYQVTRTITNTLWIVIWYELISFYIPEPRKSGRAVCHSSFICSTPTSKNAMYGISFTLTRVPESIGNLGVYTPALPNIPKADGAPRSPWIHDVKWTYIRCSKPGGLLNVLYTFNLRPVSAGVFSCCSKNMISFCELEI